MMECERDGDTTDADHQVLRIALVRQKTLKAKLGKAYARMEAEARDRAGTGRSGYGRRKAAFDAIYRYTPTFFPTLAVTL